MLRKRPRTRPITNSLRATHAMIVTMNIEYTVQVWKEGDQFVAHAMPLDVMSSGKTPEEAGKALDEAVRLFVATAAEMGTLQEVLREQGYGTLG